MNILGGAALGSAAAAGISGITGNRHITAQTVLLGTSLGAGAGASVGRNVGSTVRDAAIGAALAAGVAGLTGDRTITPKRSLQELVQVPPWAEFSIVAPAMK